MNKKLLNSIAVGVLSAGCLSADGGCKFPPLSLSTGIHFDNKYVYRGTKLGQQVFTPSVEISASLFDKGELYFGNKNFLAIKSSDFNKHDFSIGFSYDVTDLFRVDLGFTAHLQRNLKKAIDSQFEAGAVDATGVKKHNYEIYVGILADVLLNPSLYYSYDFTWKRQNIEGKVNYLYDLSSIGVSGFAVDLSAKIGYDHTKKPFGMKKSVADTEFWNQGAKKGYFYYGAGADLVYSFNENAQARAGIKYEGLNKKTAWNYSGYKNLVWFSTSLDCGF
jgi:hypothetical protein